MADSQYPFPPDRFDDEADAASFHGAHRAEEPFWRQNLIYIVIIGAAVVTLVVLLFLIGGRGGGGEDERAADPTSAAESAEPGASDEGGAAEGEGEEETTEEPAAEADKSTPVLVVNAAGINGLAGSWQETLEASGWTEVGIGTADNRQQEPLVFYRDEADAASAQALADEVGAGEATQSDEYDARITFLAVTEPEDGEGGEG